MQYINVEEGTFLSRPNRFLSEVKLASGIALCHVKNTGRCKELLVPGATVYVSRAGHSARKTQYDLITVKKENRLINIDSQAPNRVFLEYLRGGNYIEDISLIRPETTHGGSRFDFYVEAGARQIFLEIKGVTLFEDDAALFPDAPTQRGIKHLRELMACIGEGREAQAVFVIQGEGATRFSPNWKTHPAFGSALVAAQATGVSLVALDTKVTEDSLVIHRPVPICLEDPDAGC